jgi:hypothetical protein
MKRGLLEIIVGLCVILAGLSVATLLGVPGFYLMDPVMMMQPWTFLHALASMICGLLTLAVIAGILSVSWFIGADILTPEKERGEPLCPK